MPGAHHQTTIVGNKIPFHTDLFYNAICGVMGRTPDTHTGASMSGYYCWVFDPTDEAEADKIVREHLSRIREFFDLFDIKFSESECFFGHDGVYAKDRKKLIIRVVHQVAPKT